jgi:hypothetical protein
MFTLTPICWQPSSVQSSPTCMYMFAAMYVLYICYMNVCVRLTCWQPSSVQVSPCQVLRMCSLTRVCSLTRMCSPTRKPWECALWLECVLGNRLFQAAFCILCFACNAGRLMGCSRRGSKALTFVFVFFWNCLFFSVATRGVLWVSAAAAALIHSGDQGAAGGSEVSYIYVHYVIYIHVCVCVCVHYM